MVKKIIKPELTLDQIFIFRSALAQNFIVLASQGTIEHFIVRFWLHENGTFLSSRSLWLVCFYSIIGSHVTPAGT